tara:strand:- start:153 stop:587 length:435 start_codon:yes stop_codon:yes gene_type:complete
MSKDQQPQGILYVFEKFNVLPVAIGLMVGASLKDVADNLIEDLFMPFLRPILKRLTLTKKEEEEGEENGRKLKIPGTDVELNLENIIMSTSKFLGLSGLIYLLIRFGVKVKRRPKRVRIMNWDKMPKSRSSNGSGKRPRNLKLH